MKIVTIDKSHISKISILHKDIFKDSVFCKFGSKFIEKFFYKLIDNNWGFVLVDEYENVNGYILATDTKISVIDVLGFFDLIIFFKNLILDLKLINTFFISFKNYFFLRNKTNFYKENMVEISHFGVVQNFRSNGFGKKLIDKFEKEALRKKYNVIKTITHNSKLANFYISKKNAKILNSNNISCHEIKLLYWKI